VFAAFHGSFFASVQKDKKERKKIKETFGGS